MAGIENNEKSPKDLLLELEKMQNKIDILESSKKENQKTLEHLTKSEEKFKTLFENITEGVALHELIYDQSGKPINYRVIDVNPAYKTHTGLDPEQIVGKSATEIYGTNIPPYFEKFSTVAISGKAYSFETYFPPMKKHFIISVVSPQQDHFATVFEDITQHKNREEELKQKNEEMARFVYTVSHDLKSPLVTIKSFIGFLKEDMENNDVEALEKDINHIHSAASKMGILLDELLELSRVGRKDDIKSEIPLKEITDAALELVAGRIENSKINIIVTKKPILLNGSKQRLIQLYQNLIDNASKFMGDQQDPIIEIGFDKRDEDMVFFVKDNGSGIDLRYSHKIFDLFEKLDKKTEGTGIGLSLVKRIVETHNGTIWFESEGNGKGTIFYFTLEGTKVEPKEEII